MMAKDDYTNCTRCGKQVLIVHAHRFRTTGRRDAGIYCSTFCCPRCVEPKK